MKIKPTKKQIEDAKDFVKEACDYITCPCEEDGVYHALVHFGKFKAMLDRYDYEHRNEIIMNHGISIGKEEGILLGKEQGILKTNQKNILNMYQRRYSVEEISKCLDVPVKCVKEIV